MSTKFENITQTLAACHTFFTSCTLASLYKLTNQLTTTTWSLYTNKDKKSLFRPPKFRKHWMTAASNWNCDNFFTFTVIWFIMGCATNSTAEATLLRLLWIHQSQALSTYKFSPSLDRTEALENHKRLLRTHHCIRTQVSVNVFPDDTR